MFRFHFIFKCFFASTHSDIPKPRKCVTTKSHLTLTIWLFCLVSVVAHFYSNAYSDTIYAAVSEVSTHKTNNQLNNSVRDHPLAYQVSKWSPTFILRCVCVDLVKGSLVWVLEGKGSLEKPNNGSISRKQQQLRPGNETCCPSRSFHLGGHTSRRRGDAHSLQCNREVKDLGPQVTS